MAQTNDLSRSRIPFCQESTLIVVVDMREYEVVFTRITVIDGRDA
jgi:hypothetical protein